MEKPLETKNNLAVRITDIPVMSYDKFFEVVTFLLGTADHHILVYFAYEAGEGLQFICGIANDPDRSISIISHIIPRGAPLRLRSMMPEHEVFYAFEGEIHEKYGVIFENNPMLRPIRFSHDMKNNMQPGEYPFYSIQHHGLHKKDIGPLQEISAPAHFRFICNGEKVLNLEPRLGWQHRGIESLFLQKTKLLQRSTLAEQIEGDSTVGHTLAYAQVIESLSGLKVKEKLNYDRVIASEIERIAMHIYDLASLCTEVAYKAGHASLGVLRTTLLNFIQTWCGNRFSKGLIRPGGTNYPFTAELGDQLLSLLEDIEEKYTTVIHKLLNLPGIVLRFRNIGTVSRKQVQMIGGVGVTAKMAGLKRDIRWSHPYAGYHELQHEPVIAETGDIYARALVRHQEVLQSIKCLRRTICIIPYKDPLPAPVRDEQIRLAKNYLAISITEGWRGEIVHTALTDLDGKIVEYKIKDPSLHNWQALALSVKDREISDFAINDKSYHLSYCGHDL